MVAVDAATNRVFVHNYQDQSVSMLDAGSGRVLRTVRLGGFYAFLVVDVPTNRVFVSSDDVPLDILLDASSGTIVGKTQNPIFDGDVDPRTGHVFLTVQGWTGAGNGVSMLDGRNGALLHTTTLTGIAPWGVAVDARADRVFATNTADDTVSTVEASSGRLLRTVKVGSVPLGVAVDGRTGRVFITNNGTNTVSMLDARSGAVLRTFPVGPHPATAVVDERTGRVFVVHGRGGNTGATGSFPNYQQVGVTMLDARTGAVLRSIPVGGSTAADFVGWAPLTNIAVDVQRSRVFVINQTPRDLHGTPLDGDGSVAVLDAVSGSLLQTIGVGRHPISLAVEERTARLFVVNTNTGCTRTDVFAWVPGPMLQLLGLRPPDATCRGSVTVIDTSRL